MGCTVPLYRNTQMSVVLRAWERGKGTSNGQAADLADFRSDDQENIFSLKVQVAAGLVVVGTTASLCCTRRRRTPSRLSTSWQRY